MSQTVQEQNKEVVKKVEETIVEEVLNKISQFQTAGDIKLPQNYSAENAVRSAWLIIQETLDMNKKPALEVCTRASVATAMFDMVLQGLSPVKKQCYFIVYGSKLQMSKSYIGTIAVAKRVANVKDATANVIFEGDEFQYEIDAKLGRKRILKHEQSIDNIDTDKIKGAYATVEYNDGTTDTEVMTMKQIKQAWAQRKGEGESPAHKKFPDQMAMKTVISRALKIKIGSTDDSALFEENEDFEDAVSATVSSEIKQNANTKSIGFENTKKVAPAQTPIKKEEPVKIKQPEIELATEDNPGF